MMKKLPAWRKSLKAIKAEGSKAILQIYHGGRMVDPQLIGGRQPVAPSAIAAPREGAAMPRALSGEESGRDDRQVWRRRSSRHSRRFLTGSKFTAPTPISFQQFYSPNSNQRDDEWGGSRDNRARFPLAVLDITHKNGPPVRRRCLYHRLSLLAGGWRSRGSALTTPCICWKSWPPAVSIIRTSVGATLRPSIVDTSDPTPLIEKYCAMRSTPSPRCR